MPRLQPYTSPIDRLTPSDRGTEAEVMAGRRIGTFYNQAAGEITAGAHAMATAAGDVAHSVADIGQGVKLAANQVEDYLGHQEVRTAAASKATLFDQLNDEWNNRVKNADPNDPSVAAKFREEVLEPSLEKFGDAFSTTPKGRDWTESRVGAMRDHFYQKTAADMSSLAGAAVTLDVQRLGNASANTAGKSPDFHTVDYLLGSVGSSVQGIVDSAPNIKGADATKARMALTERMSRQIVESGAVGAIAKSSDPEKTAQAWTDKYSEYLSPTDAKTLASNARQQIRAARVDENYARHNQDLAAKKLSDATESDILKNVYSDDPRDASKVTTRSIVNDDRLSNPTKEKLIRLVDREMKPESDAKVSAKTSQELFARIYLPAGDPNKITDTGPIIEARVNGRLNKADFKELRDEIVNARTPEGEKLGTSRTDFMKRWAPMIDGAMNDAGTHSLLGTQKTYQFMMDARRQEEVLRKKSLDPNLTYDPRSEYFVGRPENIAKYHVTLQEANDYKAKFGAMSKAIRGNLTDEPPPLGTEVIDQKPGARTFVPPANWQFSASRSQYRDPQGNVYDAAGNKVK